MLNNHLHI
jgi:hypothetical protein